MPKIIYLSPSTQEHNIYNILKRPTEETMMNGICDFLEGSLSTIPDLIVLRNNRIRTLTNAINESNAIKSDIHLAIHSNAGGNGKASGTEVFYNPNKPESKRLAECIYTPVAKLTPGDKDRGIKDGSHLAEIRRINAPAVALIEIDFHDNQSQADWIYSHKMVIAAALFEGLKAFRFGDLKKLFHVKHL